ncbi:ATP-binding protein [Pseudomonas sp. C5pp]|uniref:ATP-binding protein n=1 Tax=Pseudomonas sp. C5pp TaxID=1586081 RepID=UPI0009E4C1E9|nr:ATP-binding protein [Pseudomonas sp. C5pp]
MDAINELIREIENNDLMTAALHHKSFKSTASDILKTHDLDYRVIDAWESLGKSVISLHSALRAVDVADKASGACSLVERKLKVFIYAQIAEKVQLTKKGRFGPGVSGQEKKSAETLNSLTNQLLGSIQYSTGYTDICNNFFDRYVSLNGVDLAPEKDSKTQLQEYCQGVGHKLPTYTLLEENGFAHAKTFKVSVQALGVQSLGTGSSKRIAELEAAKAFIATHALQTPRKKSLIYTYNPTNYKKIANQLTKPSTFRNLNSILEKLNLPDWTLSLVGLALTHRSYNFGKSCSVLGKNNAVLAFLGASVIEWLAHDSVIKNFSLDDLTKAGGIREIVRTLVNASSIAKLYDQLLSEKNLLLGPGEKHLTQAIKTEFIQALFGVLLIAKLEKISNANSFIGDTPLMLEHFIHNPRKMDISRDNIIPPKTSFQETCQLLGIKVKFQTEVNFLNQKRIAKPSIVLNSQFLKYALRIDGETVVSQKNDGTPNTILESNLTIEHKNIFDSVLTSKRDLTSNSENNVYIEWLLKHSISLAGSAGDKTGTSQSAKLINNNFLGVNFAKNLDFEKFEKFITSIYNHANLDLNSARENILKYYGHAGRSVNSKEVRRLSKTISSIEEELSQADPLREGSDLRDTAAFKGLISEATSYRLKGGDIAITTIAEIIEEFELLQRGKAKLTCLLDANAQIIEIDGSHLCLLDTVKGHLIQDDLVTIEFSSQDKELCLKVDGLSEENQSAVLASLIWNDLRIILPITDFKKSPTSLHITLNSLSTSKIRNTSLGLWWQYHFKDPYALAANDRIASILHDIKNSILGYCFTSAFAREKKSGRERYLLAAEASGHLDTAKAALEIVKSLSDQTGPTTISPINIGDLIKTLVTELWSWMPNSVTLIFTPCESATRIYTDDRRLRSLISNIVKNSVEAMKNRGTVNLLYSIETDLEGIEFSVSDTGPGFTEDQLASLRSGTPLKTSKKSGHGIGLMAVMLTAKELGGNIAFSNTDSGGACVKVWVPSIQEHEENVHGAES